MADDNKNLKTDIGKKIKLARLQSNFTQAELAEEIALSTEYISQLERGIHIGSIDTIIKVCNTLGISPNYIFSDLIDANSPKIENMIDHNFLKNYLQLNEDNKDIIMNITNILLKKQ